jgi:ACS family tartrate transporter-like MFS transporter
LAFVIGGPLSGVILSLDGVLSLHGWQWLFVIEGLPAFFLAFVVLAFLPDGPATASWLSGEEKNAISTRLAGDSASLDHRFLPALLDPRVLALGLIYFGVNFGRYGVELWLPQIVQGMGVSNLATGFVVALPYALGMAAMIFWGRSSDRRGERIWHVALPALAAAAACAIASFAQNDLLVFVSLATVVVSLLAIQGPFFSLPSSYLTGAAAAGGIALINTLGTGLGGFLALMSSASSRRAAGAMARAWRCLPLRCCYQPLLPWGSAERRWRAGRPSIRPSEADSIPWVPWP